jgi:hypothetical protein
MPNGILLNVVLLGFILASVAVLNVLNVVLVNIFNIMLLFVG